MSTWIPDFHRFCVGGVLHGTLQVKKGLRMQAPVVLPHEVAMAYAGSGMDPPNPHVWVAEYELDLARIDNHGARFEIEFFRHTRMDKQDAAAAAFGLVLGSALIRDKKVSA